MVASGLVQSFQYNLIGGVEIIDILSLVSQETHNEAESVDIKQCAFSVGGNSPFRVLYGLVTWESSTMSKSDKALYVENLIKRRDVGHCSSKESLLSTENDCKWFFDSADKLTPHIGEGIYRYYVEIQPGVANLKSDKTTAIVALALLAPKTAASIELTMSVAWDPVSEIAGEAAKTGKAFMAFFRPSFAAGKTRKPPGAAAGKCKPKVKALASGKLKKAKAAGKAKKGQAAGKRKTAKASIKKKVSNLVQKAKAAVSNGRVNIASLIGGKGYGQPQQPSLIVRPATASSKKRAFASGSTKKKK